MTVLIICLLVFVCVCYCFDLCPFCVCECVCVCVCVCCVCASMFVFFKSICKNCHARFLCSNKMMPGTQLMSQTRPPLSSPHQCVTLHVPPHHTSVSHYTSLLTTPVFHITRTSSPQQCVRINLSTHDEEQICVTISISKST